MKEKREGGEAEASGLIGKEGRKGGEKDRGGDFVTLAQKRFRFIIDAVISRVKLTCLTTV